MTPAFRAAQDRTRTSRGGPTLRRQPAAAILGALASIPALAASGVDAWDPLGAPVCPEPAPWWLDPRICGWSPPRDVDDWLPLLDPVHEEIVGTSGNDVFRAGAEGDVLYGLAGNDALDSAFDRTALVGDGGHDKLVTDAAAVGEAVRAIAIQLGGEGDDLHRASLGVAGDESSGQLLLDLGEGRDVAEALAYVDRSGDYDFDTVVVSTLVYGRSGDDIIDAAADAQGTYGDSLAINAVDAGEGDDRITALSVTEFDGLTTLADNRISGGDGDDVVDATAIVWSNEPLSASNRLSGGRGRDEMRAVCVTDSNTSTPIGLNALWGGDGADDLEAVHLTDGENWITDVTSVLEGGDGDDTLLARSTALGESVFAVHRLAGGEGDDDLTSLLDLGVYFGIDGNEATNVLEGGPGDDRLEAWLTSRTPPMYYYDPLPHGRNHLYGGPGSDVLLAVVGPDVEGASFVHGGDGRDQLTVVGGSGNVLDGGNGGDDLFGSAGDDRLIGGRGPDTFGFDLGEDQGTDTLVDFEVGRDTVHFVGLTEEGEPGVVDDLDALSTFTDPGPGGDLVIDLASGTRLVFAGLGTGTTASWGELLSPRARPRRARRAGPHRVDRLRRPMTSGPRVRSSPKGS